MPEPAPRRNRLTPWFIGLAIVLAAVIYTGYQMWAQACPGPPIVLVGVLTVIPVIYLGLMYLTFISQD